MKKLIFALYATVLSGLFSCAQTSSEKIGTNENGVFKITSSLEKIKTDWSALLKKQKIETTLVSFDILSGSDSQVTNETYYYLLAKNKDNSIKVVTLLALKEGSFYLPDVQGKATETVICSGCSYGCNPLNVGKRWICTPDCGPVCTKTVTATTQ